MDLGGVVVEESGLGVFPRRAATFALALALTFTFTSVDSDADPLVNKVAAGAVVLLLSLSVFFDDARW